MVDTKSLIIGMILGTVATLLFVSQTAAAQAPTQLDGPVASTEPPERAQARIEGGDWGVMRVTAQSGQRITAPLSLAEVTRVSFEGDRAASVRTAQNGRPGTPAVEFERDDRTGDLYLIVTDGIANQVVSTFVTTAQGHTYQFLWTIRDQPASQVFVRGTHVQATAAAWQRGGRAPAYQRALVEFAQHAYAATPTGGRDRAEEVASGIYVRELGIVEGAGHTAHVFELHNRTQAAIEIDHEAFATSQTSAVAAVQDFIAPGQTARVLVIEPEGADHGE